MSPSLSPPFDLSRRRSTHTPSIFTASAKYRTLEETAVIFDGPDAAHEIAQAGVSAVERPQGGMLKRDSSSDGMGEKGYIEKHEHAESMHVERV